MGRGRGKGKKQSAIAARDDTGSGEDEKIPVRRRGRPQKPMKDEFEEEDEVEKIEEEDEDVEEMKNLVLSKSSKNQATAENGRKRKRPSQIKESDELVKEENAIGAKNNATVLIKSVGYRQHGSRRKNKPRRAAEVGVECK
ncbi:rho GTPase-activating gacO-like protein [Perilla frutescens var. hirtella]|uniref:Rho GTPase-activating gacO-like protein n=1 Tax=Perilla frutescens var. hirtella TaxID=608512 RepID=A0AAD4J281_PERFH|nr:rho GTPase-activating gacO-like protein [Perilla frutescens var. hirtella]